MSALEPGLYRATVRGVADVIVLIDDNGYGHHATVIGDSRHSDRSWITDARPLIVLDLESRNFGLLAEILRVQGFPDLAIQIEAQTKPARIEEPPQGKRVEANLLGFPSWNEYLRIGTLDDEHWVRLKDGNVYTWSLLTNPQVVES